MTPTTPSDAIQHTDNWIKSVVIGLNLCPFAAKAFIKAGVRYVVVTEGSFENSLETLAEELQFLDTNATIETTLLIFPNDFADFEDYLDLTAMAEQLASDLNYDGICQIASFHPDYCFEGAEADDPANFTNRSIYPMLHLLREDSITKAVENYPDPEGIPERNIAFARKKGLAYMQALRQACYRRSGHPSAEAEG